MFDFVRNHKRILQFVLLIVIFPSFALFGIQGYQRFNEGAAKDVAKVDGQGITQGEFDMAFRRQIDQIRQRSPEVNIKSLDTPEMRKEVLDGLVRERVVLAQANKSHLTAAMSNERLVRLFSSDPQFAQIRNPDGSINAEFLASQGMTSEAFAERVRQDLASRQVLQGVGGSALAPKASVATAIGAVLQQREAAVKRFDAGAYIDKVAPTDADVEAYYKGNPGLFRAKEQASIEYVVLDPQALEKTVTVAPEEIRKYYDENAARYTTPEERRASHILIKAEKSAPQADRDKAKAKAQAILDGLKKAPDSFADVAKKQSEDPGSAVQGGDLDFFGRGAMVKPFEDAAFGMKVGELSPVVESDFGFHIIKLTAVRGGERKPFEAVQAEIEAERRKQLAQAKYAEMAEQFTNTVFEQPDSLQPVIDKLKLEKKTATVQRLPAPGATGVLASAKLLEAVFSADPLRNKRNTEAVEVGPSQLASARVLQHTPERLQPLAEIKDQVTNSVRAQQAAALARKAGEALVALLKTGAEIPDVKPVVVSRVQPQGLPREVLLAALKLDISKGPAATGIDLAGVGYVAMRVTKVVPREAGDEQAKNAEPLIAQALGAAESEAYYEALKTRFKTKLLDVAKPAEN